MQNVTSLAVRANTGQSNAVIDSVLLEAGQPGGEIQGENVVYLEMGVDWMSTRSKVNKKSSWRAEYIMTTRTLDEFLHALDSKWSRDAVDRKCTG